MGAYDRLLDYYFSTEKGIESGSVYRICRAMSRSEKACVDFVIGRFWNLTESGYRQSKADEVIAAALPLIEAARANGKLGGRPRKQKTQHEPNGLNSETDRVSTENPARTQHEPSTKASQSQSQSHSPSLRSGEVGTPPEISPAIFADYLEVRRVKKAGKFTASALNGLTREADRAGVTLEQAVQACCEYSWIGFNAKWYAERQERVGSGSGETPYQKTQRERVTEFAPSVAKRPDAIDVEGSNVVVLAGR